MSLTVVIKKMSQDISVEDGVPITQNFALLELPNGAIVKAAVDEEAAEAMVESMLKGNGATKHVNQMGGYAPPPAYQSTFEPPLRQATLDDGSQVMEFGGDSGGVPSGETPPSPPAKPKVRFAGKDEYGYPVMRSAAGGDAADPGEVVGGGLHADEDGVGQV